MNWTVCSMASSFLSNSWTIYRYRLVRFACYLILLEGLFSCQTQELTGTCQNENSHNPTTHSAGRIWMSMGFKNCRPILIVTFYYGDGQNTGRVLTVTFAWHCYRLKYGKRYVLVVTLSLLRKKRWEIRRRWVGGELKGSCSLGIARELETINMGRRYRKIEAGKMWRETMKRCWTFDLWL